MKKDKIKTWWNEEEINDLELLQLHSMFDCTTQEGVDVAFFYAKYISKQKLTPDNYPLFLKLLATGNHWIIDALIDNNEPFTFFKVIQPNSFILSYCFNILEKWKSGEIYSKLFLVILGILKITYDNAINGYKIYPIAPEDVNNLGKHLDENKSQKDLVNKTILHILDRISELVGNLPPEEEKIEKVANQANKIRGKFLDESKGLHEAIPPNLLKKGDYTKNEIPPSIFKSSS